MAVNTLLNKISAEIKEKIPELIICMRAGQDFQNQDFKNFTSQTPGIYIVFNGTEKEEKNGTGEFTIPVLISAFTAASGENQIQADENSLDIIAKLISITAGNNFGLENAFGAEKLSCINICTANNGTNKISVRNLTWQQKIKIGKNSFETPYLSPFALYTGLSPKIGLEHKSDYIKTEKQDD